MKLYSDSLNSSISSNCEMPSRHQELSRSQSEPTDRSGSSGQESMILDPQSPTDEYTNRHIASYQRSWNDNILEILTRSSQVQYSSPVLNNIENVMRDFQMNGSEIREGLDEPDSAPILSPGHDQNNSAEVLLEGIVAGGGNSAAAAAVLMRQVSCPAPVSAANAASAAANASAFQQNHFERMYPIYISVKRSLMSLPVELLSQLHSLTPTMLWSAVASSYNMRMNFRRFRRQSSLIECAFCKNNGEPEQFYMSHILKDSNNRVCCPILRAFSCPRCGATGDFAHTLRHCPIILPGEDAHAPFRSIQRMSSTRRRSPTPSPQAQVPSPSTPPPLGQWQRRSLF